MKAIDFYVSWTDDVAGFLTTKRLCSNPGRNHAHQILKRESLIFPLESIRGTPMFSFSFIPLLSSE